jgi:HAD superfamily hydrolase (TIGR01549 family)
MRVSKLLEKYKVVFWDFDGVLMDSMSVRDKGFAMVLDKFPASQVDKLLEYHRKNGGLSRYHKLRYFFEEILDESVTDEKIQILASDFSVIMKSLLVDKKLLIAETVELAGEISGKGELRQLIVSGSDQSELRYLNQKLSIDQFFDGIYGSPTPKKELVSMLLKLEQIDKESACLIGDSLNDQEAAEVNGIDFFGYNNPDFVNIAGVEMLTF